jgi:alanyl-tRNA synthetase
MGIERTIAILQGKKSVYETKSLSDHRSMSAFPKSAT